MWEASAKDSRHEKDIRFGDAADRVLKEAMRAAGALGDEHVGTEHLLVALAADEAGLAGRLLAAAGLPAVPLVGEVVRRLRIGGYAG